MGEERDDYDEPNRWRLPSLGTLAFMLAGALIVGALAALVAVVAFPHWVATAFR
jgi:hypothetical protein